MGKLLLTLTLALAAFLAGCEQGGPGASQERGAGARAEATAAASVREQHADPHADLACRACHQGPQGERGRATVPAWSCKASGCHESGGPPEVQVATVEFGHRDHGQNGEVQATCAGCHTHSAGGEPLQASVDACTLCHLSQVSSRAPEDCRVCHQQPDHSRLTSQGVVVSHSKLPWMEIGCVRCHYDVSEAETSVASARCRECHTDIAALNQQAVGRDLHPLHDGVSCTSCHEKHMHRVAAMSSAVDLICSDCHREEHGVALKGAGAWPQSSVCSTCHEGVHAAQQQLILGVSPDGEVVPSAKFLAGVTCRSCHVPTPGDSVGPLRGEAQACGMCHDQRYTQVLSWWMSGVQSRLNAARGYLHTAETTLRSAPDSARALLGSATQMVDLVARAGGEHNLELSDRLMRAAVERTREAYAVSGKTAPAAPNMGPVPHMGLCSYCHYSTSRPLDIRDMPDEFHQRVLRQRQ